MYTGNDVDDADADVVVTEWHTGDVVPRILSDFDGGGRSTNGYVSSARCLNTLRYYGLSDGAIVALTSRQTTTVSTTTSFICTDSLNSRLQLPRSISRPAGSCTVDRIFPAFSSGEIVGC